LNPLQESSDCLVVEGDVAVSQSACASLFWS
jgi:hypothetical protein